MTSPNHIAGRFAPGNKAAVGHQHPQTTAVQKLKAAFLDVCTVEEMKEVTRRLLELCKGKDSKTAVAAIELLFNRLFGKAKETVEVSTTSQPPPFALEKLSAEELDAFLTLASKAGSLPDVRTVQAEIVPPGANAQQQTVSLPHP